MAAPIKSQSIFLSSAQGSQMSATNHTWSANFEPGLVCCNADEYLVLSLERFMTIAAWPWIPAGTTFTIRDFDQGLDSVVLLPQGNPTLAVLARAIQVSANLTLGREAVFTCSYNHGTNKLEFKSNHELALRFPDLATAALLGFRDTLVTSETQLMVSDDPLRPLPIDSIRVELLGVVPDRGGYNATNLAKTLVAPCTTLGVIPVTAKPFTMLDWHNANAAFNMRLADTSLTSLTFHVTDWEGRSLADIGTHWLVLRVETFKRVSMTDRLLADLVAEMRSARIMRMAKALAN